MFVLRRKHMVDGVRGQVYDLRLARTNTKCRNQEEKVSYPLCLILQTDSKCLGKQKHMHTHPHTHPHTHSNRAMGRRA